MVKFIQVSFIVIIITACGGGGSNYSGVPQAPNSAPYFVDFPVAVFRPQSIHDFFCNEPIFYPGITVYFLDSDYI